mmetsp:Transcript_20443/g.41995  ORF Transcript_20443/g.41995 Transcript_20443/m.41995 type:complete len:103 (-) Transcript_20443:1096-1404(-)
MSKHRWVCSGVGASIDEEIDWIDFVDRLRRDKGFCLVQPLDWDFSFDGLGLILAITPQSDECELEGPQKYCKEGVALFLVGNTIAIFGVVRVRMMVDFLMPR